MRKVSQLLFHFLKELVDNFKSLIAVRKDVEIVMPSVWN